ncbi:MAG: sigma-70 family RNA polymerase sigma factor [Planctomycetota bacterium]
MTEEVESSFATPSRDTETVPILQRVAAGDPIAMEQCVDRYGDLIWSLVSRFGPTRVDADDVTQDVFVQLWQQAHRFDPAIASETTFIAMIARRRCIDHQRREGRQPVIHHQWEGQPAEPTVESVEVLEQADDAAKAERCMEHLSEAQKQVLTLSIAEGCSHRIIADHLAIPLGTVKSHARRALIQLRQCMGLQADADMSGGVV